MSYTKSGTAQNNVSYKDIKKLMVDLKKVYTAINEETALSALDDFDEIWGSKYAKNCNLLA